VLGDDLAYLLGIFIFLAGGVALAGAILLTVEGVYRIYCKIKGKEY
jgi:hypothetical protein